ncbi:2-amino-4-hydroxy-6-hydroxymethyldihydropteridine diphosphokinase [Paenibacillus silviterrae]|uniref:2-amino-4-hydroxy-6- hydroxymethyldihydropteridine diphosphokinase n=1 Tax=Paenibacillus silviterrae TaxID=3242194 RepID=UPI003558F18F
MDDEIARLPEHTAYIGLGSNMEDRERYLREAMRRLEDHPAIRITGQSGIYETDPVGYTEQDPFLNMVIEIRTSLTAQALFGRMVDTEQALGRQRDIRWGPRTIDLDLLLFDDCSQDDPALILPHPRMLERAFVLVPLLEVMQKSAPEQAARLNLYLERAEGKEGVKLWKKI